MAAILHRCYPWLVEPLRAVVLLALSSTSGRECQNRGPSKARLRRSSSHRLQVVKSPTTAPTAIASTSSSSMEEDLMAFFNI
jgi:hypothetical protein